MALIIHADDFGITVEQSKAILELSDACGGHGALSSMSMFANSPAFKECAELVRPFVDAGKIKLGLHLNIVEGHPVSNPDDVPLLVNERGTFSHSFMGYLMASTLRTGDRDGIREQLAREFSEQIKRYLEAFPDQRRNLRRHASTHAHGAPRARCAPGCLPAHRLPGHDRTPSRGADRPAP